MMKQRPVRWRRSRCVRKLRPRSCARHLHRGYLTSPCASNVPWRELRDKKPAQSPPHPSRTTLPTLGDLQRFSRSGSDPALFSLLTNDPIFLCGPKPAFPSHHHLGLVGREANSIAAPSSSWLGGGLWSRQPATSR